MHVFSSYLRMGSIFLLVISGACAVRRVSPLLEDIPPISVSPDEEALKTISAKEAEKALLKEEAMIEEEIRKFNIEIPHAKEEIVRWVKALSTKRTGYVERALKRAQPYLSTIRGILRREGLPEELAYLPIVESGYSPYARSRARALGIWQFMRFTARKYGLRVDWWIDERRDPYRSTEAAAHYLKDLYAMFGRWDLALAAYNVGEGRLGRRLKRTGASTFWEVRRHLPRETRNYVPAFFATVLIVQNPESYGLRIPEGTDEPAVETVNVPYPADLSLLAEWAGTTPKDLKKLNPQFLRWATPPDLVDFPLRIPADQKDAFVAQMQNTPKEKWITTHYHRVRSGETLSEIAAQYNVPIHQITRQNGLRTAHRIRTGQLLHIQAPGGRVVAQSNPERTPEPKKPSGSEVSSNREPSDTERDLESEGDFYTVRRGDNLLKIARRFGTSVSTLRALNGLSDSRIYPGQKLRLVPQADGPQRETPPSEDFWVYQVRSGDTLWDLAKRHGTTISELKTLNGIEHSRKLRAGETIRIPKD